LSTTVTGCHCNGAAPRRTTSLVYIFQTLNQDLVVLRKWTSGDHRKCGRSVRASPPWFFETQTLEKEDRRASVFRKRTLGPSFDVLPGFHKPDMIAEYHTAGFTEANARKIDRHSVKWQDPPPPLLLPPSCTTYLVTPTTNQNHSLILR
jgi:hypothetical protein